MENSKNIRIFSKSRSELFIVNNFDKIGMIVLFIVYVHELFYPGKMGLLYYKKFTAVIFLCLFLIYVFDSLAKGMIYMLKFDLDANEVTFNFFRERGSLTVQFNDIEKIGLYSSILFFVGGKKIFYDERYRSKELDALIRSLGVIIEERR